MADPKKVRWSQLKVGVLGIAAFLVLGTLIFLLTSSRRIFRAPEDVDDVDVFGHIEE